MTKWEYRVEAIEIKGRMTPNLDELKADWLNNIGSEGWELVVITAPYNPREPSKYKTLVFKRPIE